MPVTDPEKKRIAQNARLIMQICFNCGCRNDIKATRCRKCRNNDDGSGTASAWFSDGRTCGSRTATWAPKSRF